MAAPIGQSMRLLSKQTAFALGLKNIRSLHKYCRFGSQTSKLFRQKGFLQYRKYCYDTRKVDITGGRSTFTFDTHSVIKNLQESGMPLPHAEALTDMLVQISQAKMDYINRHMITKPQHEIATQQMLGHLSTIKKDMVILEKTEFSALKHEYEKQNKEIEHLRHHFKDELGQVKSGVSLDLNLERSRAKDAHGESEKDIRMLQHNLDIQRKESEKLHSMLDNKIEKEIAQLLATYERYRNDIIKYAGGTIMTCLTICLGFYRLWS